MPGRRRCATLGSVAIITVPGARRLNVAFPGTATRMAAPTSRGHPTTAVAEKLPGRQARYRKFATLKSGDGIDRQDILSAFGLLTAGATVVGHVMDRFTPMSDRCDLANRIVSVSVIRALMAATSSSS